MPSHTHNTPALRFPGYTGVWEQQQLKTVTNIVNRTDENSSAPIMMITAQNGFIDQSERYAYDNTGASLKKYIILHKGELAYNHGASKLRPYGSCFALDVDNARVPFVYHCFSTSSCDPYFLSTILNSRVVEHQLRRLISSGARMDGLLNISYSDYSNIYITLPTLDEQKKITQLLRTLDGLINLHQRQTQKLRKLKQGLLQEMFPREGESVPRLRFPGFTTTWKQQKLKEIANFLTGHIESKSDDVLLPASGYSSDVLARTKCNTGGGRVAYIMGGVNIIRPHNEANGSYLSLALNNGNELIRLVQGSIGKRIPFMDVKDKVTVLLPELEEQQKIAEFFNAMSPLCEKNMGIVDRALLRIKDRFLRMMFIS